MAKKTFLVLLGFVELDDGSKYCLRSEKLKYKSKRNVRGTVAHGKARIDVATPGPLPGGVATWPLNVATRNEGLFRTLS